MPKITPEQNLQPSRKPDSTQKSVQVLPSILAPTCKGFSIFAHNQKNNTNGGNFGHRYQSDEFSPGVGIACVS